MGHPEKVASTASTPSEALPCVNSASLSSGPGHNLRARRPRFAAASNISDKPSRCISLSVHLNYFCVRQAFIRSKRDKRVRFLATNSYVSISNSKSGGTAYSRITSSLHGK